MFIPDASKLRWALPNGKFDEELMRKVAMDIVSKELKPIHEWMLSFWSNGSGRPPGYFQMRVIADDERYKRLECETKEQSEVLKRLDENLQEITVEKKIEAA